MNTIYELPPMLNGSAERQLGQLRDYLVRLVRELPTETQLTQAVPAAAQTAGPGAASASPAGAAALKTDARLLKALIVKTADRIYEYVDRITQELSAVYLAQSDFGSYLETVDATIETTARGVVESYNFQSQLDAVSGALARYSEKIDGEIRRGFIPDPDHSGEYIFGIAVAQKIVTTGVTRTNAADSLVYEELNLDRMSALGLYTATGWQFWINGNKAGWFDAEDGMLHVPQIVVESELKIGADWLVTSSGGFGIR